jgi:aminomethyltransferase
VLADRAPIGEVTSGTFSPTLEKPIAMAYVPPQYSPLGTELVVDIRGSAEPARVVKLPFYVRSS